MNASKEHIRGLQPFDKPDVSIKLDKNKKVHSIDDNGLICNYQNAGDVFFAFIDVLGFKKAFEEDLIRQDISTSEDAMKSAVLYGDVFAYFFELISRSNLGSRIGENDYYAGQTSDTIYFYTKFPNIMLDFLKIFSYLNLYAMTKNVFFRGGIAHGNLYKNQAYQFYGESVIRAYQLENDIAKNPVIIVDDYTLESLSMLDQDLCKEIIIQDKSGRNYIEPFALWKSNYSLEGVLPNYELRDLSKKDVKESIESNVKKHEYDSRNYSKYIFLLNRFKELFTEKTDTIGGEVNE